tara:strand:+ start:975 stop:1265 length:291 start_codon:yes stop_codon:yes gene_type:complete
MGHPVPRVPEMSPMWGRADMDDERESVESKLKVEVDRLHVMNMRSLAVLRKLDTDECRQNFSCTFCGGYADAKSGWDQHEADCKLGLLIKDLAEDE